MYLASQTAANAGGRARAQSVLRRHLRPPPKGCRSNPARPTPRANPRGAPVGGNGRFEIDGGARGSPSRAGQDSRRTCTQWRPDTCAPSRSLVCPPRHTARPRAAWRDRSAELWRGCDDQVRPSTAAWSRASARSDDASRNVLEREYPREDLARDHQREPEPLIEREPSGGPERRQNQDHAERNSRSTRSHRSPDVHDDRARQKNNERDTDPPDAQAVLNLDCDRDSQKMQTKCRAGVNIIWARFRDPRHLRVIRDRRRSGLRVRAVVVSRDGPTTRPDRCSYVCQGASDVAGRPVMGHSS